MTVHLPASGRRDRRPSLWLALILIAAASTAHADYCSSGRSIAFGGLNWESGQFITAVTREILERGFGCRTEAIPGNTITLEQALANDDVQIIAEEWINRSEVWKKAAAAGQVQGIGHTFTDATEGWAVPDYLVQGDADRHLPAAAPELTRVEQLAEPRYVALFKDPEQPGRGRFLNCPSGWTCQPENTAKLRAYGLSKEYVDFKPGTGPAMDAAIFSAYLQRLPVLFYYWSPSGIAGRLRLTPLIEPPYTPECWQDTIGEGGAHSHGCASPPSEIVYGVSSRFASEAPDILSMLQHATWPMADLNANLAAMSQTQRDAKAQAIEFLERQPEVWHPWVTAAIASRIDASLQNPLALASAGEESSHSSFPPGLVVSIRRGVNDAVTSFVTNHGSAFRAAAHALLRVIVLLDTSLRAIPWWLLIALFMLLAWLGGRRPLLTLTVGVLLYVVGLLGLWDLMVQTLTLMLISSGLALLIGLPVGVLTARFSWLRMMVLPTLDVMQTMPSFVYLLPALMLFGLGKVPAIIATVIYALPPMIRLTALGIEQVDAEVKEAATAFGVTPWYLLLTVEIPLARPSIMAGVNQTIMLALSMVVVASMIGARGLGEQVLNGIQSLDVGLGLEAGIGIVILAIVIDRITQGFGKQRFGAAERDKHG